jgi:CRP-like cAMP-binding protein
MPLDIRKLFESAEGAEVYQPGDVVFQAGEQAHHMYVVVDGDIELRLGERVLGTAHAGDLLGEMAVVGNHKRTATAVATSPCRLVPINERRFVLLVQETPYFALHVMKVLAERVVRKEREGG